MTSEIIGILAAGALTLGFALIGEALLGRTSRDVVSWNESFLIGAGTAAAILFPFSLVAPHHALDGELVLMVVALLVVVARRRRHPAASPAPERAARSEAGRDRVALLLGGAIFALFAYFCALNHWISHSWDSVVVFATRAKLLVIEGGLSRRWFLEDVYDNRLVAYPPLISLFEALYSRVRGSFEFDWLKPIFPYFYASWIVGTYAAARTLVSRRWALGAVLLVALLPEITTHAAAGGYVDMPLAAFVAASVAAALRKGGPEGWRSPVAWLLGSMTAAKQEGMILALVACGAVASFWLSERPRRFAARARANGSAMIVIAGFIAARVGYVRWTRVHDTTWGPFDAAHVERAVRSVGLIVSLCLRFMLDPRIWGLFWPAFLVAAIGVATSGPPRLRLLVAAIAACAALEAGLFLFTNWDFQVHIEGAYARLLSQLAPAAAVVIVFAASRIWAPPSEKAI